MFSACKHARNVTALPTRKNGNRMEVLKMKNAYRIISALLAAGAMLLSCAKEIEPNNSTYTMTVSTGETDRSKATKALGFDSDGKLVATWKAGERVTVYNVSTGTLLGGYLEAQNDGPSTELRGTVTGEVTTGNTLELRFLSPSYDSQEGTIEYIESNCDYATATVNVASTAGGNISILESNANFVNQQAIVKFILKNSDNSAPVLAKPLKVTIDKTVITVTPADYTNELYVAVPAICDGAISLTATTSAGTKGYTRSSVTFAQGKYYEITVKMSDATIVHNETELNSAITNGAYIILANDIPLAAYVRIGQSSTQRITIDLAGYTLSRSLSSSDSNGHVIEVFSSGNLSLNNGTLTGGWANNGGGICNYGTASLTNVTISGCKAANSGGAIMNHGTATLIDVTVSGNTSKDAGGIYVQSGATLNLGGSAGSTISDNTSSEHGGGGIVNYGIVNLSGIVNITGNTCHTNGAGIWSNGTLTMQGNIRVKDNTGDDVFLKTNKLITTGTLTCDANSIGVNMETKGVFTSGYGTNNMEHNHFFASGTVSDIVYSEGEARLETNYKYISCSWDAGNKQVVKTVCDAPASYTTVTSSTSTLNDWNVVSGTVSRTGNITCGNDAKLILLDKAQLSVTGCIIVENGNKLTIYCQSYGDVMGKITVATEDSESCRFNAAIGVSGGEGNVNTPGIIVIHGGDIKATANCINTAGIGGGSEAPGTALTIYGGRVEAHGADNGAGIGSGTNSHHHTAVFPIPGEDVPHTGRIAIYDGVVYAYGGNHAAGIGGGFLDNGGKVIVHGGRVEAHGGEDAAGIGSGQGDWDLIYTNGGSLTVNGGSVYAYGGDYGAGIGGGQNGSGATVEVNGGYVYADGGEDGAGIGSGEEGWFKNIDGGKLTVNGGHVVAAGAGWGAGIGAGQDCDGADVHIYGGIVEASAGAVAAEDSGCAFGSEEGDGSRGSLVIEPGMRVYGGDDSSSAVLCPTVGERVPYCYFRPYARIEPCTSHSGNPCTYCNHSE